jgi:hypothetical protein
VPEPFTPEAGKMGSKEEIDGWIDVLPAVIRADPLLFPTGQIGAENSNYERFGFWGSEQRL